MIKVSNSSIFRRKNRGKCKKNNSFSVSESFICLPEQDFRGGEDEFCCANSIILPEAGSIPSRLVAEAEQFFSLLFQIPKRHQGQGRLSRRHPRDYSRLYVVFLQDFLPYIRHVSVGNGVRGCKYPNAPCRLLQKTSRFEKTALPAAPDY